MSAPTPERRGTAARPRKKSKPSLVPCVSTHPRVERDSCSAKEEVNAFLGALCQHPPQRGEGQLLSQGRSQCLPWCLVSAPTPERRGTAARPRKKSMPSLVPYVSTHPRVERDSCSAKEEVNAFLGALCQHPPQRGEGQLLSQGRSQCLPWCPVSAPTPERRGTAAQPRKKSMPSLVSCVNTHPREERESCSAKEEVNVFLCALCQHPPQRGERELLSQGRSQHLPWCTVSAPTSEWKGTAAKPMKKSMPSLVPCVSTHPRVERDSCSAKEEANTFLGALCQHPPQRGEGELLSQGRSQRLPWCPVSAPTPERTERAAQPRKKSTPSLVPCVSTHPREERESCSAKEEVNAFLGALCQHPPQSGEGQLLSQGRSQRLPWCPGSAPTPERRERESCSAKEEVNTFLDALCQHPPQSGEGQLLSQGRSQHLPWCPVSAPTPERRGTAARPRKKSMPSLVPCVSTHPREERESCSAKEEVNAFLGALCQHPPQRGEGQLLGQGRSQCLPWCPVSAPTPERRGQLLGQGRSQCLPWCPVSAPTPERRGTAARPRKKSMPSLVPCVSTHPREERDSCSAKEEVTAFLGALCQHPPQRGEGQLLSQGRSHSLPWCPVSAPTPERSRTAAQPRKKSMPCVSTHPREERDSCSAKEEVNAFLGALCQHPPQRGERQLLSQGRNTHRKQNYYKTHCMSWCP